MTAAGSIELIVNADDFGYFDQVSVGILEAAERGVVTATGVMANGPALRRHVDRLKGIPGLSCGIHLNATLGRPLTPQMRQVLSSSHGEFPGAAALLARLLSGGIPWDTLIEEWQAQIQHCIQLGIRPAFVNSHEHVHMLPTLYRRVRALAATFGIRHVRAPGVEWSPRRSPGALARGAAFALLRAFAGRAVTHEPRLLGVLPSGRLDLAYCKWAFGRLVPGSYELMCHPGHADPQARSDPKLAAYHDWQGEFDALTSEGFRTLLAERGVRLIGFEQLTRSGAP
jgi:predicted glycoside hydrolase/deacetylase ChbG (UPF0249 family)